MGNLKTVEQIFKSIAAQQSIWEKARAEIARPSAVEQAMKSVATQKSVLEKIRAEMARPSALEQAMKSVATQQSAWEKVKAEMVRPSAVEQAMKSVAAQKSVLEKIRAEMARPSALEQAMKSVATQQSAWEKIRIEMARPSVLGQAMKSVATQQSVWEKIRAEMARPSAIEQALKIIARSSDVIINQPNSLSVMADSISENELENNIQAANIQNIPEIFQEISENLYNAPDANSFLKIFSRLPSIFKTFILFMIFHVFLSQINGISANLLTPIVESFLNENVLPKREQINHIKKLPITIELIDTTNLRFVTGNNVRLRKLPSTRSEILDEMAFGQIVTVLHKKRNWIEVSYEYDDGEIMQGWIFTRYTAKFKK